MSAYDRQMHAHSQTQILPFSVKKAFIARVLSPLVRCSLPHSTAQLTRLLPSPLRPPYSLPQALPSKIFTPQTAGTQGSLQTTSPFISEGKAQEITWGKSHLGRKPNLPLSNSNLANYKLHPTGSFLQRPSGPKWNRSQIQKGSNASSSKFQVPLASQTRGFLGPELPAHSGSRNKSHLCFEWFQPQNFNPGRGREGGKRVSDSAEEGVRMIESRVHLCTSKKKQGRNKAKKTWRRVRSGETFFLMLCICLPTCTHPLVPYIGTHTLSHETQTGKQLRSQHQTV